MVRTHFFDNDGTLGSETLSVEGRTWTCLGRQAIGACSLRRDETG